MRTFPQLEGRALTHAWGGPIDISPAHLPSVGPLGDRLSWAAGYTGNGVGPSHLCGRILARLALGRADALTALPLVGHDGGRVPPEPLRWAGGTLVLAAMKRVEAAEELGSRADPLSRLVAGLPSRLGITVGR